MYVEGACCLLLSVFSVLHLVLFCYGVPCFPSAGVLELYEKAFPKSKMLDIKGSDDGV
jgi:hypothetical protein